MGALLGMAAIGPITNLLGQLFGAGQPPQPQPQLLPSLFASPGLSNVRL